VAAALEGQAAAHMLPWVVRDLSTDSIVGTTRYHDIVPSLDRVEIGWTWYAARVQGTHLNPAAKLLLQARRDGTVRDSVMYSILRHEWPDVKRHLTARLTRRS
jgi:RimJ/RimL family protein N-acetyltransferase